jgi:hypothetical protein
MYLIQYQQAILIGLRNVCWQVGEPAVSNGSFIVWFEGFENVATFSSHLAAGIHCTGSHELHISNANCTPCECGYIIGR